MELLHDFVMSNNGPASAVSISSLKWARANFLERIGFARLRLRSSENSFGCLQSPQPAGDLNEFRILSKNLL